MDLRDVKLGGPCSLCGEPQAFRAANCTRSRAECPYGKAEAALITALTPMRLARMLKLYVATHEGLTQKQVAQEAGIGESTLSRFLSGEQMPDGRAFAALVTWCFGEHRA